MPLVFSPLTEAVLDAPPKGLFPKTAFIMRQLGDPPLLDQAMAMIVEDIFHGRGVSLKDADHSTGGKDFLERILGLIRGTSFTVAIFSSQTRPTAMANIALELGFAAMCGKPIFIVKSVEAAAPSDLTRTDWIVYDPDHEDVFRHKLMQALDEMDSLAQWEQTLLSVALEAPTMDCAIAFERANKAFLLTGEASLISRAGEIGARLGDLGELHGVADIERLKIEIAVFIRQARQALAKQTP